MKRTKYWGGFVGGHLMVDPSADGYSEYGEMPSLFTTRKAARARFQDVRRVEVRIIPNSKRKPAKGKP